MENYICSLIGKLCSQNDAVELDSKELTMTDEEVPFRSAYRAISDGDVFMNRVGSCKCALDSTHTTQL